MKKNPRCISSNSNPTGRLNFQSSETNLIAFLDVRPVSGEDMSHEKKKNNERPVYKTCRSFFKIKSSDNQKLILNGMDLADTGYCPILANLNRFNNPQTIMKLINN